jgi:hypothetical protein
MAASPGAAAQANGDTTVTSSPLRPAAMTPAAASKKSDFLPRLITGLAMIAAVFLYVFFFRQVGIAFLVLLIQFFIYRELVSIAIKVSSWKFC